jgi:hypothetical protein
MDLLVFVPLAVALFLMLIGSRQSDPHWSSVLVSLGGLFTNISIIGQGVFLIVVKKRTGMGITTLILGATVLGFGLHVLLRTLQL